MFLSRVPARRRALRSSGTGVEASGWVRPAPSSSSDSTALASPFCLESKGDRRTGGCMRAPRAFLTGSPGVRVSLLRPEEEVCHPTQKGGLVQGAGAGCWLPFQPWPRVFPGRWGHRRPKTPQVCRRLPHEIRPRKAADSAPSLGLAQADADESTLPQRMPGLPG